MAKEIRAGSFHMRSDRNQLIGPENNDKIISNFNAPIRVGTYTRIIKLYKLV